MKSTFISLFSCFSILVQLSTVHSAPMDTGKTTHVGTAGGGSTTGGTTGQQTLQSTIPSDFKGKLQTTHQALGAAAEKCTEEVRRLYDNWEKAVALHPGTRYPAEIGITHQMEHEIIVGGAGYFGSFPKEHENGADAMYAFELQVNNLEIFALLQMKIVHFPLVVKGAPNLKAPSVDWLYKSGANFQMDLLERAVATERAKLVKEVHVLGGYVIFAPEGIIYVPIEDVKAESGKHATAASAEEKKRLMTEALLPKHKTAHKNFIDAIIAHAGAH